MNVLKIKVIIGLLFIEFEMDTEITMTTESPMETASPQDVDISNEVLERMTNLSVRCFMAVATRREPDNSTHSTL